MTSAFPDDILYRGHAAVLLLADDPGDRAAGGQAVELAGARLIDAVAIDGAAARLADQVPPDAVLVLLAQDAPAVDPLLHVLEAAARDGRHGSVVAVPPALVDAASARLSHPSIRILVEPTPAELALALVEACATPRGTVREIDRDPASVAGRMAGLGEELARIAQRLAQLSSLAGSNIPPAPSGTYATPPARPPIDAAAIRALVRLRRLRDHVLGAGLFADPVWDMLLDLAAARREARDVAVSSLCIAAAVPPTTALRWIAAMAEKGLLVRRPDPADRRRVFIDLSDAASAAMDRWFEAAVEAWPPR